MDICKLISFLGLVDNEFNPRISEQVRLEEYSRKLCRDANLITECGEDGEIYGLVAIYVNDRNNKYAYIPLVAVRKDFRRKGLARKLVNEAIMIAKANEKDAVDIHTNNPIGYNLYISMGFTEVAGGENKTGHPKLRYTISK